MNAHTPDFEILTYDECIKLLGSQHVGRVAWVRSGRPNLVPVNYAWDGEALAMRTDPGAKLDELTGGVIAFEIDLIDDDSRSGWSVVVIGEASEVTEVEWPLMTSALKDLVTWAPGAKDHWVRLKPSNISGRRLGHMPDAQHNTFWRLSASE